MLVEAIRNGALSVLDFALPPRCAGCGVIMAEVHSFCPDCWKQLDFLGAGGCETCGLPLELADSTICAGASRSRPESRARAPRSPMASCREDLRSARNTDERSRSPRPWRDTWRLSSASEIRAGC